MCKWRERILIWFWIWATHQEIACRKIRERRETACGSVLSSPRGVIQTPGFPRPFPTPIHCEWVIDRHYLDQEASNASIVVYFTQMFLAEGLTFTEYQVYDRQFQLAGREIHRIDETNIARVRYLQSFQNYLVITLKLDSSDATHLRVLDNFLDVYGFNITYEVSSSGSPRPDACTMMDCGFTGTCYDQYDRFECDCLPGYKGQRCSAGPNSLCEARIGSVPPCLNGGTCLQVGAAAVKCLCPAGYLGDACELTTALVEGTECDSCCPDDVKGHFQDVCKCSKVKSKNFNADGIEISFSFEMGNLPKLKRDQLKKFITHQIFINLAANHTKLEVTDINRLSKSHTEGSVTVRIESERKDEKLIRSIITKWLERGHISNITIAGGTLDTSSAIQVRPSLELIGMSVNVPDSAVREGEEFIVSCVARGSPDLAFRWHKDGYPVNVTAGVGRWTRIIKDPHVRDQYTGLLGVSQADRLDAGLFLCTVTDSGGRRRCAGRHLRVVAGPEARIEPVSLTAHKGDNFTIKCVCSGRYTYSWTKNRELLPVQTASERYEILYPGGSLLQVTGIERDTVYSCLVQSTSPTSGGKSATTSKGATAERSIMVSVVEPGVRTCPGQRLDAVLWPETAPDTVCRQECPRGYRGIKQQAHATRMCALTSMQGPVWLTPDYSSCVRQSLHEEYLQYRRLRLGYGAISTGKVLEMFLNFSRNLVADEASPGMLPGEGASVAQLAMKVFRHVAQQKEHAKTREAVLLVMDIIDQLLGRSTAFVTLQQVETIQRNIKEILTNSPVFLTTNSGFHKSYVNMDLSIVSSVSTIRIPLPNFSYKQWVPLKMQINLYNEDMRHIKENITLSVVIFRNLTTFLPYRSSLRRNDYEAEYTLLTPPISLYMHPIHPITYTATLNHPTLPPHLAHAGWAPRCALAEVATAGDAWILDACDTASLSHVATRCRCSGTGAMAVLLLADQDAPASRPIRRVAYVVVVAGVIGMVIGVATSVHLTGHWIFRPSCLLFLKIQSSFCTVVSIAIFISATLIELERYTFLPITSALASALLLGSSSHLSTLLVIWTEVMPFSRSVSRSSVAALSTGLPILAVFGNHMAHRTMDVQPLHWWLRYRSLAFDILAISEGLICLIFLVLHLLLLGKMNSILKLRDNDVNAFKIRSGLLHRSCCVFAAQLLMISSSVVYINQSNETWTQYLFGFSTILLGMLSCMCYCILPETNSEKFYREKAAAKEGNQLFDVVESASPLNYFPKQEGDIDGENMSKVIQLQMQPLSTYNKKNYHTDDRQKQRLENIPAGQLHPTMPPSVSDIATSSFGIASASKHDPALYERRSSQREIQPNIATTDSLSPDILGGIIDTGPPHNEDSKTERSQPDGREKDKLDGMLDSISHDLDYLLNRGEGVTGTTTIPPPTVVFTTNTQKSNSCRVMDLIKEESEEDIKVPDPITSVLRTNC